MPKVGGLTFRSHLETIYGKRNVFHDYTPCQHPDYVSEPPHGYLLKRLRHTNKTTVIYGHFFMERYFNIPGANFICWVRNPVERVISHYYYWLKGPDPDQPACNQLIKKGLSIVDFARLIPNMFTKRFYPLKVNDFSFVGLFEDYNDSLKLFYDMFAPEKKIVFDVHINRNYARNTSEYKLSGKMKREIEEINSEDMKLYRSGVKRYNFLVDKYRGGF